jgi:hypothetical protein
MISIFSGFAMRRIVRRNEIPVSTRTFEDDGDRRREPQGSNEADLMPSEKSIEESEQSRCGGNQGPIIVGLLRPDRTKSILRPAHLAWVLCSNWGTPREFRTRLLQSPFPPKRQMRQAEFVPWLLTSMAPVLRVSQWFDYNMIRLSKYTEA